MFRGGQTNPYDDIVGTYALLPLSAARLTKRIWSAKATDENLTSENWEVILALCDKIVEEGEQGCVKSSLALAPSYQPGLTGHAM